MRALTVRQPWASLIISGAKDVENRSWRTPYRGPLVITASAKLDRDDVENARSAMSYAQHHGVDVAGLIAKAGLASVADYPLGVVIGIVDLVDCTRCHPSPWAIIGDWHWVLANPRRCEPVPVKGALGLWNIDDEKVRVQP